MAPNVGTRIGSRGHEGAAARLRLARLDEEIHGVVRIAVEVALAAPARTALAPFDRRQHFHRVRSGRQAERREERGVARQHRVERRAKEHLAAGAALAVVDGAEDANIGDRSKPAPPDRQQPAPFGDRRDVRVVHGEGHRAADGTHRLQAARQRVERLVVEGAQQQFFRLGAQVGRQLAGGEALAARPTPGRGAAASADGRPGPARTRPDRQRADTRAAATECAFCGPVYRYGRLVISSSGLGAWLSGRASPSHGGGRWFDSSSAHQPSLANAGEGCPPKRFARRWTPTPGCELRLAGQFK